MSFPCSRCGLCCQNIRNVELLRRYDRGDGVCVHYCKDAGCLVYKDRPMACRIDEGYEVFAMAKMGIEDYYRENARVCNQLQEAAGLSKEWRVWL